MTTKAKPGAPKGNRNAVKHRPATEDLERYREALANLTMTRKDVGAAMGCHHCTTYAWIPAMHGVGYPAGRPRRAGRRVRGQESRDRSLQRQSAEAIKRQQLIAELSQLHTKRL